jgi:shikimate kinase
MSKPNIILTGFMGTGKTTVGRLLAKHLDYELIDTDGMIESRHDMTVAEIFAEKGETAFRAMETGISKELAGREGLVIATGGRLMLDEKNAAVLGASGQVFCLSATAEEIFERIKVDTGPIRPLLEGPDPFERIVSLLDQRSEGYGRFPQILTSGQAPQAIAQKIIGMIQSV